MRPAVLAFAPLLLLPFLACTDLPTEPGSETAAPLFGWWPEEPGEYIVASANGCGQTIPGSGSPHFLVVRLSFQTGEEGVVGCSVLPDIPSIRADWVPVEGSMVTWTLSVSGGSYECEDGGEVDIADLPQPIPGPDSPCFFTNARFLLDRFSLE